MIKGALKNPYAVAVLALAILVIGLTAITRLPTDILPTFKTSAVQILTFYPGMPAEVMEKDITTRLERWTGQANGVARQESKSMVGVSVVKDFFREDVDPNTAMSQVTSLAMSDLYYLPPGTIPPMVMPFDPTASIPLCLISVSSPTFDETKLYDVAYFDLRNRLQSIPGVIAPAVYGGKLRRILAYVDPEKASSRGLSPLDVINSIRNYNVMIPTGNAKFGALDYQINANGMVATVKELNDLPLNVGNGSPTYIRDVASVEDSSQIQLNVVRVDGKRQVYIPIYRQPGANTIAVVEGIKAQLKPILERIKGINLDVVMDQSFYVRESINNLIHEAIIGAGLAALLVLIFLGSFRPMFIVLLSLPLACLGAFIGLYFTGESLNAMTLGGLALAVGLLIDQSIVVIENVERHLALGKSPMDAARDGAMEVAKPLLIITVTLAVVFFPVVFLTGIGKFLFTPLAKTVIIAIGTSYILALTLVPVCAAKFLRHKVSPMRAEKRARILKQESGEHPHASVGDEERFEVEEERGWFHRVRQVYTRLLNKALALRWVVLGATAVLFVGSLFLFKLMGTELFPQTDAGQFMVKVRGQTGLRIERSEELIAEVEKVISTTIPEKERKIIISNIGVLLDWPAAYTPNSGPQDAFILVQLAEKHGRSTFDYVDELRAKLPEQFPGIEFSFDTGGMMSAALNGGLPSPINIQVEGNQLEAAHEIAEKIKRFAETVPGAVDVRIQQRLDAPEIKVDVDRVKSAQVGITQEEVVKNIVTALNSSINFAPSFWIDERNGNHYFIGAQYRESDIKSLETVLDIPITGKKQATPIPLRNLATFKRATAPSEINHLNITRVTDIYVNVRGRDIGSVAADIEKYINQIKNDRAEVPEGYYIQMRGEVKSMRDSFQSLGFGFALAVVLVYLVMVVQFRSFLDPFIVMFAVPLGLIGVALMLYFTGTYLSIQSAMGIIMMVGIVVSFSVIMVDFANRILEEAREKGQPKTVRQAIVESATLRLRPILMVGLAAILGLTPMAIAGGANIPLARAVVGGLLAAVVMVLFVVPILYLLFKAEKKT
ncbi:MAG: efflux RND transporter permease subunit [Verrucomicrobia subdivision 3 bacterium]|nr:efflux RND transporter permease subunit [Limisphaerales bacterium]